MQLRKNIIFLFQFATVGLALAFLILYFYPELLSTRPAVVQLQESSTPVTNTPPGEHITTYATAVDKAAPAVVNIYTTKVISERRNPLLDDPLFQRFQNKDSDTPRQTRETSLGSGVIVSAQGYIITNNHVIAGADEIAVALHDGRTVQAKVVGADPESDIAVLKIDFPNLPVITFGHSKNLRVGDVVLAIGNPFGVGQTVTSGIVSALGRNSLGINTFENFIQTDAAINPGNSGGALINAYGDLIGINTAIYSESGGSMGIGFAIPVSLARDVLTQIIEHGHVIRGWLGVKIQDISPDLATSFKLASTDGAIITNIVLNGPADKAGLDRGDVIIAVAGKKVRDVHDTLDQISQHKPGEHIDIKLIRDGKEITKTATIIQRPTS
ncbi:MAG: Do family serine endopeptidase [Gammaproteobacteria bacterium]|nr:Do family serine endopeptidase [Gammaproteobacteria bacterium]